MKQKIKREWTEFRLLLQCVPASTMIFFVLSVFSMNLLANKSLELPFDWLALDCGIIFSWFVFLTMDIMTKHFGPKGASELSVFAIGVNLFYCLMFFCGSRLQGVWGESFVPGSESTINNALDHTLGGTWYVVLGSTAAFITSALINNFSNYLIGKAFKKSPDSFLAYICRTYISTAIGQFCDNLVFALAVSHFFFGWTLLQCITCAVTGMLVELLGEILFSYFGFRICKRWQQEKVGEAYLTYIRKKER